MYMPAEQRLVGSGLERAPMRTRAHNRAESSAPPAPSVSPHRLWTGRGVVVGVFLGLLAWVFFGLLLWLLA